MQYVKVTNGRVLVATLAAVWGGLAATVEAAPFLSVDFQSTTTSGTGAGGASITQSNFQSFAVNTGIASINSTQSFNAFTPSPNDDVTVTVTSALSDTNNNAGGYARNNITPTLANAGFVNLYNDFLYFNKSGGGPFGPITIELSGTGIIANGAYELTFYSYDGNGIAGNQIVTYAATAGTTGTGGSIIYLSAPANQPTSLGQYANTFTFTANNLGVLTVSATGNLPNALRVNGFQISAVPEPASVGVLLLAGGLVVARRRR